MASSAPSNLRRLSSHDLVQATDGFHVDRLLGKGGEGEVYRGFCSTDRWL